MLTVTSLRRARLAALLLATALVVGVANGLLLVAFDSSDAFETWWGTAVRALVAVVVCFAVAGRLERRWSLRGNAGRSSGA